MQAIPAQECGRATPLGAAVLLPLAREEQARADLYALIARLLITPPESGLLDALAAADSLDSLATDHPLDRAWESLVLAAGVLDAAAVHEEFNDLFISAGTPQINPYASLYLGGFLHEKPLVALRTELAQLGLARIDGAGETEDHLAALCEAMRLMIAGGAGVGALRQPLDRQKQFFEKHIASWSSRCLDEICALQEANFYRRVAEFSREFFLVEAQAFDMADELNSH
ncbi:molecular chaperone TorD family protein [Janthinobacterium sp. 17J80-10]|uniref:TorD/DmsD family molecular chaperone n=1 Tax=Janthinobacterium sp. 17J80-10 TaxID=2497863 RepID=UPI00100593D6|nr:molecular chaperone TorD family protein [Janthinobacterium sp. 17J80-10]QAU34974.1 hypothetical protein EKL02_12720 [Janthinobacterium sp. 17J80-10]